MPDHRPYATLSATDREAADRWMLLRWRAHRRHVEALRDRARELMHGRGLSWEDAMRVAATELREGRAA